MKTEDLKLFIRVAELGSFTAAANAMDLPRSNVSRRISDLEHELKSQLFHRTTRTLSLTHNGNSYYKKILKVVELLDRANQGITGNAEVLTGKIKVGLLTESHEWVQSILFDFQDAHPEVELDIRIVSNGFDEMFEMGLDISFHAGQLKDSDLIAKPLIYLRNGLYASPEYIAGNPEITRLEDLHQHKIICFRWPNGEVDNHWKFQDTSILLRPRLIANSIGFIRKAIVMDRGIGFVPEQVIQTELAQGQLVQLLPHLKPIVEQGYLLHPKTHTLNQASRTLIDYLAQRIPETIPLSQLS